MRCLALLASLLITFSGSVLAQTQITVTHGAVPAPTYIDLGTPGDSVGDQRIWQFDGQTPDNRTVVMEWIMTTTGRGALVSGMETRVTSAVFSFDGASQDTILVQGVGLYPLAGSTLKSSAVLQRAVIGGTGKYTGAMGSVTSTHLANNTWQHVFNLK